MLRLTIKNSTDVLELNPQKIIAVGLNYFDHVKESQSVNLGDWKEPSEPVLFSKTLNTLISHGESIRLPKPELVQSAVVPGKEIRTDHEAELAIVISKTCSKVSEAEALSYVLGYTCFNDVSQRNLQKADVSGWFRGKSLDTFGPIGPVLVLAADLDDPQKLGIRCRVNGKITQESNTSAMIFSLARIISYISHYITLEAHDIIATGTPSGVSAIKAGDIVEVEIDGIGVLKNPVVQD